MSLGRDGLPDGTDYWGLRGSGITTRESDAVCGDYDADQVISDLDEHMSVASRQGEAKPWV